ncbi:MAG: hydrogenase nickel incorporation protein HypB [archaeon GB-1867-035]|nr:hydrogenase nickel incorporation protein HypB [Candidatus Culexmicrobium profundum]
MSNVVVVRVDEPILESNKKIASQLRELFASRGIHVFEFLGSPGSGKTALIEKLIECYPGDLSEIAYIGGDVASTLDTERILRHGVKGVQVNTGGACHLEAIHIRKALRELDIDGVRVLFIENVGNLICPIYFDLGSSMRILIVSVTEGEDKFIKHPVTVMNCDVIVINKYDLVEVMEVDVERMISDARRINPKAPIVLTSAKTNYGIDNLAKILGLM